jgi:hypothetical protein
VRRILTCLLAIALSCLCGSVLAHPALWVARQGDSTVYLFGPTTTRRT